MIMQRLTVSILLLCLLAGTVKADPITFQQVKQDANGPPTSQTGQPAKAQEGTPPEFVRLPDGRIVPYGPGTICRIETEDSAERIDQPNRRKWLIAVPLFAAGILCAVLCHGDISRTAVSNTGQEPTVTPTPTPTPPSTPVPEPGTLILLGVGLAFLAQFGFKRTRLTNK